MQKVEPEKPEIANDGNDLVNSESKVQEEVDQSTAQKTNFAQAQFVSAGNAGRDFVSTLISSNIEDIIEEEEEEEDEEEDDGKDEGTKESENKTKSESNQEKDDCLNTLSSDKNAKPEEAPETCVSHSKQDEAEVETSSENPTVIEVYGENTKFTLEAVVLEEDEDAKVENTTEVAENKDEKDEATESAEEDDEEKDENKEESDSNEIRVEEGYATRQMDEFFRQTIAQIKEELTKKLENNEDEDEDIGDFSDEDADSDYDDDYDDEFDEDDIENQRITEADNIKTNFNSYRAKRNILYQQLLAPNKVKPKPGAHLLSSKISCWLVLLGCILNMVIIEGFCFNYLNIFNFVREEFHIDSRLVSSLPATFLLGFFLLVSPVAIFLSKTYGIKRIALFGSVASSISLTVSSFQDNIYGFIVTYGVFTGISISLVYVPSLIALSKWFLKDRLTANSLVILGTCVGVAFYPILSEFLIKKYEFYGALLILAAVQLNCTVGSMLLTNKNVPFSLLEVNVDKKSNDNDAQSAANSLESLKQKKKDAFKPKTPSLTFLVENEVNNEVSETTPIVDIEKKIENKHTREYNFRKMNNQKRKSALRRNLLLADANSETQSNVSSSTVSYNNYTLKQYWRKFVQTRQNNSNAKKNLFHLIAEEKKKTRTLSKTSLEDGFVITTSNNLLAPNDEENVIIFARKAEMLDNMNSKNQQPDIKPLSATSRFLTRIANSIRSLTQSSHINQSSNSTIKIPAPEDSTLTPKISHSNLSKLVSRPNMSSDKTEIDKAEIEKQGEQSKEQLPLQLISVFEGPITDEPNTSTKTELDDQMPANLASVFTPINNLENDLHTNLISPNEINYSETNSDEEEADQKSTEVIKKKSNKILVKSQDNDDEEEETPQSYVRNYTKTSGTTPNSILKTSRYISYRSSLTNSVRGSLLEYTVPEDGVHNEFDINNLDSASVNFNKPRYSRYSNNLQTRSGNRLNQKNSSQNTTLRSNRNTNSDGLFSLTFNSLLMNTRRFVSTIDASGFFNFPVNLESVEHNLRNSLIKKNSDHYRRNNRSLSNKNDSDEPRLFLQYLGYVFNFDLFFNPLLFFLNLSFFFNIIGFYVSIVYFNEFCINQGIPQPQSLYIFFLIILMQGFGRVFSTLLFKCNESSAKGRIFTYNLTLICLGLSILSSTVLCDTVFSLTMFAIVFGSLYGFNSNLRSTFIYDVLGLNWSDDCLFAYACISQSLGVFIGLPLAGLVHDMTDNFLCVFYFAGICFIISGLILIPGKKLTVQYSNAYKALNRFYFQRK